MKNTTKITLAIGLLIAVILFTAFAPKSGTLLTVAQWNSGDELTASQSGTFFVPSSESGTDQVRIPEGLPVGFHCDVKNSTVGGIDINALGSVTINGLNTGKSYTNRLRYGVVHITCDAVNACTVGIDLPSEDVLN